MAARRRALTKPHSVTTPASTGTACAVHTTRLSVDSITRLPTSKTTSRPSVNTSSEENSPMKISPAQVSASDSDRLRILRASKPIGINNADRTSVATNSHDHGAPRVGANRHPM
jgi:hypothetical protein